MSSTVSLDHPYTYAFVAGIFLTVQIISAKFALDKTPDVSPITYSVLRFFFALLFIVPVSYLGYWWMNNESIANPLHGQPLEKFLFWAWVGALAVFIITAAGFGGAADLPGGAVWGWSILLGICSIGTYAIWIYAVSLCNRFKINPGAVTAIQVGTAIVLSYLILLYQQIPKTWTEYMPILGIILVSVGVFLICWFQRSETQDAA